MAKGKMLGRSLLAASILLAPPALARRTRQPPPTQPPVVVNNPNANEWTLIGITSTVTSAANNGAGVTVALLDGLTDCTHSALSGHCTATKLAGGTYTTYDNHGTHTAGIIAATGYGVAPAATILNYGVFDSKGWIASGSKLANAWTTAASKGASIASMSFGCTGMALCFTATEMQTIASSQLSGMLFVKAAGNDGTTLGNESIGITQAQAQAAMGRIILVGSVDANGAISSFSNRPGENCLVYSGAAGCTDALKWKNHFLVAPGEVIYSTLPGNKYGYMSGTSMATPVVAGVAALLEARWPVLKSTPEAVATLLFNTATDLGAPGVDGVYGYGLINASAAFQSYGNATLVSPTGSSVVVNNSSISSGSGVFGRLAAHLAGVTVYDSLGRDFALGEISSFSVRRNLLAMRTSFGQQLLGLGNQRDWSNAFFSGRPAARGWASFGGIARLGDSATQVDRSLRAGVDLPIRGGVAQLRLTGAADSQLELAHDQTLRPLGFFASSNLLNKSMIGSALLDVSPRGRLMVYGTATTGTVSAAAETPFTIGIAQPHSTAGWALDGEGLDRRQVGIGVGYWAQSDADTIIGVNLSMMMQKHGYYDLESNLDSFDKPTSMINLGAAVSRRFGDWELSLAGEATHLRSATSGAAISLTPATLASASVTARKSHLLFGAGDHQDSLALSLTMPPRAIAGSLDLNFMARTTDGLGRQAVRYRTALSALTNEPMRVEGAYQLVAARGMSVSLAGGTALASGGDQQLVGSFAWHF